MDIPRTPEPGDAVQARQDEAQWQRALNEGWGHPVPREAADGRQAQACALQVPGNVVELGAWRLARARRAVAGLQSGRQR